MKAEFSSAGCAPDVKAVNVSSMGWTIGVVFILSGIHNVLLLALPVFSIEVMSLIMPSGDVETLVSLVLALAGALIADTVIEQSRTAALGRLCSEVAVALQSRLTASNKVGHEDLRTFEQLSFVRASLAGPLGQALLDAPCASIFLCGLFYLNSALGFIALILALITFGVGAFASWSSAGNRREAALDHARLRKLALNSGSRYPVSQRRRQGILRAATNTITGACRIGESSSRAVSLVQLARAGGQGVLIAATALLVSHESLAVGGILATTMLFSRIIAPVERCADIMTVREVCRTIVQLSRSAKNAAGHSLPLAVSVARLTGSVSIENVSLGLSGVVGGGLSSISLEIKSHSITALIGRSGAGKSLLLATIAGAVIPKSGFVKYDGLPAQHLDYDNQENFLGYLSATQPTLSGSITEVICGDKLINLDKVVDVSESLGLSEFIDGLSAGLQTQYVDALPVMSRGQQQQLMLARAFYMNPTLILLDDPTAFLDDEAELRLIQTMESVRQHGSNVVVATRSDSLMAIQDRVICLRAGSIVGDYNTQDIEALVRNDQMETA